MASPLEQAGAVKAPSKYAPLHTNRFFTGLWTQRNPLRDAAVPYLYEKFYAGSRFDSLLDGLNSELTARLTLARRSGNSIYNTRIFPGVNRFYNFRAFSGSSEQIRVMVDSISGDVTYTIVSTGVVNVLGVFTLNVITQEPHGLKVGDPVLFNGLTTAGAWLNGLTKTVTLVNDSKSFQVTPAGHGAYAPTADTGTVKVTGAYVFDGTGPSTQLAIWKKDPTAGSTYFQSVGNTLYFGNGVEQKKWLQTAKSWAANTLFQSGDFIVDTNLNIQVAIGDLSLNVTTVQIDSNVLTLTLSGNVPVNVVFGLALNLAGFTGAAFLNGNQISVSSVTTNQIVANFTHANYAATADTGTASWTNGNTGALVPNWNNSGLPMIDGAQQWVNKGPSVQNWGITAPTTAPTVANTARPSPYPDWAANTFYNPSLVIVDSNGNLQIVQTAGQTGAAAPVWNVVTGGTTADNTVTWKNLGPAAWASGHAYSLGDMVSVTYTYYVIVPTGPPPCFSGNVRVKTRRGDYTFASLPPLVVALTKYGPRLAQVLSHDYDGPMFDMGDGELVTPDHLIETKEGWVRAAIAFTDKPTVHYKGKVYNLSIKTEIADERHYFLTNGTCAHNSKLQPPPDEDGGTTSYPVTVTEFFKVTTAGTSGGTQPHWATGIGTLVYDNQVQWTNQGTSITWPTIGANTLVSNASIVIDSNGNKQQIATPGKSGAAAPTWKTVSGQTTIDNTASWLCQGQFSAAGVAPWFYSYAFKNSVSGEVSTAAPVSSQITLAQNKIISVQGQSSSDPQVDTIQIYRTLQGGSDLLFVTEIRNPSNPTWSYNDANTDDNLNELIRGQINNANDPPPTGLINLTYHLGRVFGSVGNTLRFSNVNSTNGVTTSCFRPVDAFILPSKIVRSWSTPIGLITMTVSDMYITLGQGTASSPFYTVTYLEGIGILSYDAFTVNGSTAYLLTTASKAISLDPSAGVTEVGFPIGDQFLSLYNPALAYLTWHEGSSGDTALYAADGATGWFRMSPNSAPETGVVWSPRAQIVGGCKAVQSVEVLPGIVRLLVGPAFSGPILRRDTSVNQDNGVSFAKYETIGSIVMAQPGSLAELEFITVDAVRVGTRPKVGILLDEISGQFEDIPRSRQDPPLLPPSTTLFNDRYIMSQNQQATFCRHFQIRFTWAAEDAHNELLAYTIFGAIHEERM